MTTTKPARRPARKPRRKSSPIGIIHDDAEYDAAVAEMNRLAIEPEGSLARADQDRLELLALVIDDYDDKHFAIKVKDRSPVAALKYLMEMNELKAIDLAELFGGRSRVSDVLSGKRELSKAQVRALAQRFQVDANLFL